MRTLRRCDVETEQPRAEYLGVEGAMESPCRSRKPLRDQFFRDAKIFNMKRGGRKSRIGRLGRRDFGVLLLRRDSLEGDSGTLMADGEGENLTVLIRTYLRGGKNRTHLHPVGKEFTRQKRKRLCS